MRRARSGGSGPKGAPIYGPGSRRQDGALTWSHWGLWFCLVAALDHDGDPGALAARLEAGRGPFRLAPDERKLSHLDDLVGCLARAGRDPASLADPSLAGAALRAKARRNVLDRPWAVRPRPHVGHAQPTPPAAPGARPRGRWDRFPASPPCRGSR